MAYEYDERKSERTLQVRGIDFEFATRIFDGDYLEIQDDRREYGERRFLVIGPIEGRLFAVVYTWRNGRRRIISARRANRRERDAYQRAIA